ncbi:hypothetical protein [Clostridium algidicarnis]|uniref:hypothetical protein n=1 Tax=Clostridium algidicarnis TaxID=37659 RepID=UPI003FD75881
MKTYKTWEVIKMLSENNDLEFKTNIGNVSLKEIDGYGEIIAWEDETPLEINAYTLGFTWELVQHPVDFITAINNGERIKSAYSDDYNSVEETMSLLGGLTEKTVLKVLNGEWFIESEN